jgi:hypothetical protein
MAYVAHELHVHVNLKHKQAALLLMHYNLQSLLVGPCKTCM